VIEQVTAAPRSSSRSSLGDRGPQDPELAGPGDAARLGIERALWFSYTDHNSPGPDFWTDRAGLFTLSGSPKPAWYAFAIAAAGTP
jgi:hypothetical protein